ncbi:DUF4134 domain-containing protein [Hymenobacter setariae]|uniref:DUF4134 domain-containing protein n=1 Tax=Hymenobacter setariae TaxID=2594794 RepID=A0A558BJS3_9BACT|nr:DUF4134 domain-containing protein [Hymenobacter setariae]TVT36771.1 DUF4134 domain-containing protein [Hymenobacter setariae]
MNKKQILSSVAILGLMLCSQVLYAQGGASGGTAGIQDATTQVTNYFDPLTKLMYAIGAVLGLIGAIKVYSKWNAGDQDTQKTAVSWFGSMIFLVLVATVVRSFFL